MSEIQFEFRAILDHAVDEREFIETSITNRIEKANELIFRILTSEINIGRYSDGHNFIAEISHNRMDNSLRFIGTIETAQEIANILKEMGCVGVRIIPDSYPHSLDLSTM